MITVAGIFSLPDRAERAASALRRVGLNNLNLLFPGATEAQVESIPTSETEQPGMGAAMGGVLGGALGVAGGLGLGSAAATVLVPGVGPVLAIGMAAAAIFGAGGAVSGAAAGAALEHASTAGIPADELFVYKDALCRGKSIVFVNVNDGDDAERARSALAAAGAESLDAAREHHWIGLRSAEREHYTGIGGDFDRDEHAYRRGFETALAPDAAEPHPNASRAFRCGYQRGLERRSR
jgi:hypothetical protein